MSKRILRRSQAWVGILIPLLFSGCFCGPGGEMGGTALSPLIQAFIEAISHYIWLAIGVAAGTMALLLLLWFQIRKK